MKDRLKSVSADLRGPDNWKTHHLEKPMELVYECDKYTSGLRVHFGRQEGSTDATVGAFLKDERGDLYVLSSVHGNDFDQCTLSGPSLCTAAFLCSKSVGPCEENVFQTHPLVDVCLIKVQDKELQKSCTPFMPNGTCLCGPYTGPSEDIAYPYCDGHPRFILDTHVKKYGQTTHLTSGHLVFCNFNYPEDDITDALVIFPEEGREAFTEAGDSGAVVFREEAWPSTDGHEVTYHQALAVHCAALKNVYEGVKVSLAFRLDVAIEHLRMQTRKDLKLLSL